jgi:hypothetical protein
LYLHIIMQVSARTLDDKELQTGFVAQSVPVAAGVTVDAVSLHLPIMFRKLLVHLFENGQIDVATFLEMGGTILHEDSQRS